MSFIRHCFLIMSRAFEKRPLMYFLIVISQVVSVLCIFFAFGLITHAYTSFENASEEERAYYMELYCRYNENMSTSEKIQKAEAFENFEKTLDEMSEFLKDNISEIKVYSWLEIDGEYASAFSTYSEDDTLKPDTIRANQGFFKGKKIGDTVEIKGKTFTIAGWNETHSNVVFRVSDTPLNVKMKDFLILTKEPFTYDVYVKVKNTLEKNFPNYTMSVPAPPKLLDIQMGKTQITLSAVLIVIVVLNCSLCYMFLYESRKKTFAIYRICGAKEEYCMLICITEVIVYMILSFAGAYLLFDNLIKNIVVDFYPKSALAYNFKNYLFLFGAYTVATMMIMTLCIISFISKPIVEERK